MAYQQPSFMQIELTPVLALASITARNATSFSDASKRAVTDRRQLPLGQFTASGANAGIQIDWGSIGISGFLNRAVIPPGHNLQGQTVRMISGTASGIGTPTVLVTTASTASGVPIDFAWTAVPGHQYMALDITTSSASNVFNVGELAIGARFTLSADAWVQPSFGFEWVHSVTEDRFGGREATVQTGPPRRAFRLEVRNLQPNTFDFIILDAVAQTGRATPFWYWPPDSADGFAPYLVKLIDTPRMVQESRAPVAGVRYSLTFNMLEQST